MRTVTLIPTGGGTPVVIFDGNKSPLPDACPEGFKPIPARIFQNSPLFRASAPAIYDRFNMAVKWEFTAIHSFSTYMACQDFQGARAGIARTGEIMILNRNSQSGFTRYLRGATLQAVDCMTDYGGSCIYRYSITFTGGYSITP
jgi:hypothetical protein